MLGSLAKIEKQAREEIAHEDFLAAVAQAKARIRATPKRPWWSYIFPWRIVILTPYGDPRDV